MRKRVSRWHTNRTVGIPDRINTKLAHGYNFSIVGDDATILSSETLNLNDLFDPNDNADGLQPRYYDQLCNDATGFYTRYKVSNCKWYMTLYNEHTIPVGIKIITGEDTAHLSATTIRGMMEESGPFLTLQKNGVAGDQRRVSGNAIMSKLFGKSIIDNDYGAQSDASPSEKAFLHILIFSLDNATILSSSAGVICYLKRIFTSQFTEKNDMPTS